MVEQKANEADANVLHGFFAGQAKNSSLALTAQAAYFRALLAGQNFFATVSTAPTEAISTVIANVSRAVGETVGADGLRALGAIHAIRALAAIRFRAPIAVESSLGTEALHADGLRALGAKHAIRALAAIRL